MRYATCILALALLTGCTRSALVRHPDAVDELDARTYDTLLVAQAVLDNAKVEILAGRLPASAKPTVNAAGGAYDTLRELWLTYRAKPDASVAEKIAAATLIVNRYILDLRGLGVKH